MYLNNDADIENIGFLLYMQEQEKKKNNNDNGEQEEYLETDRTTHLYKYN